MTDHEIDHDSAATARPGHSVDDDLLTIAPTDSGWSVYSEGCAPPYGTSSEFENDASEDV